MQNSIFTIAPYKYSGSWVFDDERVGLVREPFVAGADTLIDLAVGIKGVEDAERGFVMYFSRTPFPGAFELDWVREESGGNVYVWKEKGVEAWLCPSLLLYFPQPPERIYVDVKGRG